MSTFKRCLQSFSQLPLGSEFTPAMFKEIPDLKGISKTSFSSFFYFAKSLGAIFVVNANPKEMTYRKNLDISWSQIQKLLDEKYKLHYQRYGQNKKTKRKTSPPSQECIPMDPDSLVVVPAEEFGKMKETIIHQDWTIRERNKEVETLKKNLANIIDENKQLQAELRSRPKMVRANTDFMKTILPDFRTPPKQDSL